MLFTVLPTFWRTVTPAVLRHEEGQMIAPVANFYCTPVYNRRGAVTAAELGSDARYLEIPDDNIVTRNTARYTEVFNNNIIK